MLWTQENAISNECAEETIGELASIYMAKIYAEEAKETPCLKTIKELDSRHTELIKERQMLYKIANDDAALLKIRTEYGALIKTERGFSTP
jgi:hypothetical protein